MLKRLLLFISALVAVSSQSYGMSKEALNLSDSGGKLLEVAGTTTDPGGSGGSGGGGSGGGSGGGGSSGGGTTK